MDIIIDQVVCIQLLFRYNPRLVLLSILNAKFDDFMILFGLVCSSFVTISKGTHWRCPTCPLGLEFVEFVQRGNEFTSKTLTSIK